MQILHSTWIPEAGDAFIQRGTFVLWAESTERKRFRKPSQRHPRQLVAACCPLPTMDDQPLPSLELSRYLEEELPETFDLQY